MKGTSVENCYILYKKEIVKNPGTQFKLSKDRTKLYVIETRDKLIRIDLNCLDGYDELSNLELYKNSEQIK